MEERARIVQYGGSKFTRIPRDFHQLNNVQHGDYFMWTYDENSGTAFLRLIKPKKPKPETQVEIAE
jgi:hypothetical protein